MTDTPTLEERLRRHASYAYTEGSHGDVLVEAADEIERLRNALQLIAEGEYDYGSHIAERALSERNPDV